VLSSTSSTRATHSHQLVELNTSNAFASVESRASGKTSSTVTRSPLHAATRCPCLGGKVHVRVRLPGLALWPWALTEFVFHIRHAVQGVLEKMYAGFLFDLVCGICIKRQPTFQVLLVPKQVTRRGGRRTGFAPQCSLHARFRISLHRRNPEQDASHFSRSRTCCSPL
jgi:hypothetical protein